jgi:branched-chain amino acid transport system substrate-binding protein
MRHHKLDCLILLVVCVVIGSLAVPCVAAEGKVLTIGFSAPLSGRGADYGRMQKQGVELAVQEINAKGGIKGFKFEVVTEDDKMDPKEAANIAKKFGSDEKIKVVVGGFTSSGSFAAAPIFQKARLPFIVSLASNPKIPDEGTYIFQNATTQLDESPATAWYAVKKLGAKKIALIHSNDDWGRSVREYFPKAVQKMGGEMVAIEAYTPGEVDFRNLLIKLKALNPDVLYCSIQQAESAQFVLQAKELNVKFPFFFGGGTAGKAFLQLAGAEAEGKVLTTSLADGDPDPIVQKFMKQFRAKYNEFPTVFSAYIYDSVYLVAKAVESIRGEITRNSIRDALAGLKDVPSTCGVLSAEPNRHFGPRKLSFGTVKNGTLTFLVSVNLKELVRVE